MVFFLKKPSKLRGPFKVFKGFKIVYAIIPGTYLFEHFSHIIILVIHTSLTLLVGGLLFGGFKIDINVDAFQLASTITNIIGQISTTQ